MGRARSRSGHPRLAHWSRPRAQFPDVRIFSTSRTALAFPISTKRSTSSPCRRRRRPPRFARRAGSRGSRSSPSPSVRRDHHSKSNPRAMLRTARGSRSSSRASSSRRPWWRQRSRHCGPRSTGPMPRSSWFATHPLSSPDPRLGNGRTRTIVYGCSRHQTGNGSPLHATRPHRPRRAGPRLPLPVASPLGEWVSPLLRTSRIIRRPARSARGC